MQLEKESQMLEVDPIWRSLPPWTIWLGIIVVASVAVARYERGTDAFLERMSESRLTDEQKSFGLHAASYRCLRNIQASLVILVFIVGFAVLFLS